MEWVALAASLTWVMLDISALTTASRPAHFRVHRPQHRTCKSINIRLEHYIEAASRQVAALSAGDDEFESFVERLSLSLEQQQLPLRPIDYILDAAPLPRGAAQIPVHPSCAGDFMEFGVWQGGSINKTAKWLRHHCPPSCGPAVGFDTFQGLPESWTTSYGEGAFSLHGVLPPVEDGVQLVQGLFADSIPQYLQQQKESAGSGAEERPLAFLHVDCDLYTGAKDVFTLLDHKIVPGTVLLFDEIVNYANYRDHELKALYEWLVSSGASIAAIGIQGPLPGKSNAVDLDITEGERPHEYQSAAFVVVHKPGSKLRLA